MFMWQKVLNANISGKERIVLLKGAEVLVPRNSSNKNEN